VCLLPPHPVGVANHGGDRVDDGLRDGPSDFCWKPAEVVALLSAKGNRVIAVVVNPVAGPDLTILALTRRNVISFWLREELPNRRFQAHKVTKWDWFQNRAKLAGIRAEGCSEATGDKRRFGKGADHRDECPGGLLFPPEQVNGATFAGECKPEKNTSTKFNRSGFSCCKGRACHRANPFALAGGEELRSGWAARKAAGVFSQGGTRRSAGYVGKP
jgi:hypothetical protein